MKKGIICVAFAVALVLSIGVAAYAAAIDGFDMSYLPGTSDTVTNMPDNDSGVGGEPYNVSSAVPQREGYKFLGWELDYGVTTSYTVRYLEEGTNNVLASNKDVTDQKAGTTVTEIAINIDKYNLIGDDSQSKTLVQNAEENVITFYYAKRSVFPPDPLPSPEAIYIVRHIVAGSLQLLEIEYGTGTPYEWVQVFSKDFRERGYYPLPPDNGYIYLQPTTWYEEIYEYIDVPEGEALCYRLDDSWYRIIPGNELELHVDDLQRCFVVAKKDNHYTIWTRDELTESQKRIQVYESFSTHVYGMLDAEFENCEFMYADGSTLNGMTINGDYISFDESAGWSLAVGFAPRVDVVKHEEDPFEQGNEYIFWYQFWGQR